MELAACERVSETKGDLKNIRRQSKIPAILYSGDAQNKSLTLEVSEFEAVLREIEPGSLPTTIFDLHIGNQSTRAIIKDIQYQPTTYRVWHVDFEQLSSEKFVTVKVPVKCLGVADCVGIKLGGFLRQVLRHIPVKCLPKDIPQCFYIDVRELGIKQSKKIADLEIPSQVKPIMNVDQVVVVISKRSK